MIGQTTLVGVLPVPHPIVVRRYIPNAFTNLWCVLFFFSRNQTAKPWRRAHLTQPNASSPRSASLCCLCVFPLACRFSTFLNGIVFLRQQAHANLYYGISSHAPLWNVRQLQPRRQPASPATITATATSSSRCRSCSCTSTSSNKPDLSVHRAVTLSPSFSSHVHAPFCRSRRRSCFSSLARSFSLPCFSIQLRCSAIAIAVCERRRQARIRTGARDGKTDLDELEKDQNSKRRTLIYM